MSGSRISGNSSNSASQRSNFDNDSQQPAANRQPQAETQRQQQPAAQEEYTIRPGDTLTKLAERRGISLDSILRSNPQITNPNRIYAGQRLNLGGAAAQNGQTVNYTIRRGDTLSQIASRHNTTVGDIMRANPGAISNRNLIFPGQQIRIPTRQNAPEQPQTQTPGANQTAPTPNTNNTNGANGAAPIGQTAPAANSQAARINLDEFLSPERGSNAGFAVVIGAAEGNRTPSGGFTEHYNGHRDPGDGLWNIGSFSRANARFPNARAANSPQEADQMHLQSLQSAKAGYVEAMNRAGLDPNDALLASAYFDAVNQSPRAARQMLAPENLAYIRERGVSVETMKEWRVGGFVNLQTGERWRNANGSLVGGGLARIADQQAQRAHGRPATEQEIQALIRRDQGRRMDQITRTLDSMNLLTGSNPAAAPQARPQTPAAPVAPGNNNAVTGTGLPDTTGMSEAQKYDVYARYFESRGVNLNTQPDQRSILGLRVPTNSKTNNNRGAYDDRFVVMWTDRSGQKHVREFSGNTEPNYRYVANGRGRDINGDGRRELASIREGAYQFSKSTVYGGPLAGQRALREEDNTIRSIYDTNGDGLHNESDREADANGILFHSGSRNDVGSMGCQTLPPDQFDQFWNALGNDSNFTYLLVDTSR